jgi:hypothetical protein
MKESNDQGLANQIGPESCVTARKDGSEALTGVRAGWPLSPESIFRVPTLIWVSGRPHRPARQGESRPDPAGPREPMHARTHLAQEAGRSLLWPESKSGPHRESLTGARR